MVPTLDGGERFVRCLDALSAQRPRADALVVVDSSSADDSAGAARAAGATVLTIPRASFGHGRTRNDAAAALPDVDVIVFLVQDAIPRGHDWLARLASAALADGVGAATARQVPPPDAPPLTRSTVSRSPVASTERRRVGPFAPAALAALRPAEWAPLLVLDDVACAVRGALFRRSGFRDTSFGEDALLAYDLLWSGWALAHEPDAVVEHGHAYDPSSVGPRYEEDARFFRETFGHRVRPGWASALKGWLAEVRADWRWSRAADARGVAPGAEATHERDAPQAPHAPHERDAPHAPHAPHARGLLAASLALRWAQVRAQRRGSQGPCGALPVPRALPRPGEEAA